MKRLLLSTLALAAAVGVGWFALVSRGLDPHSGSALSPAAPGEMESVGLEGPADVTAPALDRGALNAGVAATSSRSQETAIAKVVARSRDAAPSGDPSLETIRGHVRFPNGEPLPGVYVRGKAADPLAESGVHDRRAKTANDGSFEVTNLAPGRYEFAVTAGSDLPIVGNYVLQSGDLNAVLVVDAVLLRVSAVDELGEIVSVRMLDVSSVIESVSDEEGDFGSITQSGSGEKVSVNVIVPTGHHYLIQGFGPGRRSFFAQVRRDVSAGVHELLLREHSSELGGLKVTLAMDALSNPWDLRIGSVLRNGFDCKRSSSIGKNDKGAMLLEVRGLLPGRYDVGCFVRGKGWEALRQPAHSFDLSAGEIEELQLETFTGGRFEASVTLQDADVNEANSSGRVKVEIRRPGESSWTENSLSSRRNGTTRIGERIRADGTPALSGVLARGTYGLRVTLAGYQPYETHVSITEETSTPITVTLWR